MVALYRWHLCFDQKLWHELTIIRVTADRIPEESALLQAATDGLYE